MVTGLLDDILRLDDAPAEAAGALWKATDSAWDCYHAGEPCRRQGGCSAKRLR